MTCRIAAIRLVRTPKHWPAASEFGPDSESEPAHGLTDEISPACAQQAADQPDAHIAGHLAHDLVAVACHHHADDGLERQPGDDDRENRQWRKWHAETSQRTVQGDDEAFGGFLRARRGDDERDHHGQADEIEHTGNKGADNHQNALAGRRQRDDLTDRSPHLPSRLRQWAACRASGSAAGTSARCSMFRRHQRRRS